MIDADLIFFMCGPVGLVMLCFGAYLGSAKLFFSGAAVLVLWLFGLWRDYR